MNFKELQEIIKDKKSSVSKRLKAVRIFFNLIKKLDKIEKKFGIDSEEVNKFIKKFLT